MDNRELLERIRAIIKDLEPLIDEAERNTMYYSRTRILNAASLLTEAEGSLRWHVEGD